MKWTYSKIDDSLTLKSPYFLSEPMLSFSSHYSKWMTKGNVYMYKCISTSGVKKLRLGHCFKHTYSFSIINFCALPSFHQSVNNLKNLRQKNIVKEIQVYGLLFIEVIVIYVKNLTVWPISISSHKDIYIHTKQNMNSATSIWSRPHIPESSTLTI